MELISVKNFEFKPSNITKKEVPPSYIRVSMENELIKDISDNADINSNKFSTEIKLKNRSASILVWKFKLSNWKGAPLGNITPTKADPELMSLIKSHPEVKTNEELLMLLKQVYGNGEGVELFSKATGSDFGMVVMHPDEPFTLPGDVCAVALSIRFYENGKYVSNVNNRANNTYIVLYNQSEEKKALPFAADTGKKFAHYICDDAADFINAKSESVIEAIESSLNDAGLSFNGYNEHGRYLAWISYKDSKIKLVYSSHNIVLSSFHDMTMSDKVRDRLWAEVTFKKSVSSADDIEDIDFAEVVDDLYNRRNSGKLLREYDV